MKKTSSVSIPRASVFEMAREGFPDDKVLAFVNAAVEEGRAEKWSSAGLNHNDWNRRASMYYGTDKVDRNKWIQRPRENRAWRALENQRYVLMDHMPVPEFQPRNPDEDYRIANDLTDVAKFVVDVSNYKRAYAGFINNMLIYGTGIMKTYWCDSAFGGRGMTQFAAQDPRSVLVNPGARSIEEAAYVVAVGMEDVDGVVARYPEHEDKIRAADKILDESGRNTLFGRAYGTLGGSPIEYGRGDNSDNFMNERGIEVMEVYARIPVTPGLEMGEGGSQPDYRVRVFVVVAGQVIVRNDWLPYDHGRLPFVTAQSRYYHDRVWGISDLEIIESLQQELNRMSDKRSAWIELSYFPWILNPASSGVPDEQFIQAPGTILHPSNSEHGMGFMVPPEAGRHIQGRRMEIHTEIDEEIGTYVISADHMRRNIAPTTVAQYREAGESPVRMKIRFMEPGFTNLWLQTMDLMRQYYEPDVFLRVLGDSGKMRSKKVLMDDIRTIKTVDETRFDIRVGLTGNAAISRAARRQEMVEAIQAGAFNPQLPIEARIALLDSVDFPGRAAVINKWKEEEKQAQEIAEQQIKDAQAVSEGEAQLGNLKSTNPDEVANGIASLPPEEIERLVGGDMGAGAPPSGPAASSAGLPPAPMAPSGIPGVPTLPKV